MEATGLFRPSFRYLLGKVLKTRLIRRYKRFLADVEWDVDTLGDNDSNRSVGKRIRDAYEGSVAMDGLRTVYCPNTGPMVGLLDHPRTEVCLLRASEGTKRKYPYTLELIRPEPEGAWIGIHSSRANSIVELALSEHALEPLEPYVSYRREVKLCTGTRLDFVLKRPDGREAYVEVKSVTLARDDPYDRRVALFPDTKSTRASKHLMALSEARSRGHDACCLFLVQRDDCVRFEPCFEKDPTYAKCWIEAQEAGVRMLALSVRWTLEEDGMASLVPCAWIPCEAPLLDRRDVVP